MPSLWEAPVEVLGDMIETCETKNEGQLVTNDDENAETRRKMLMVKEYQVACLVM